MSVDMPPELAWVARLAVGQAWPKGNEDHLHALGQAWQDAAQELKGISGQIGATGNGVLESVGGQVADEFQSFVTQLESSLPEMAESANQLGKLGKHTAVQVEYSKYMILGQLILLAAQIAEWIFFAPEVIPVAITAARVAVKMILRRLLISVATGVAMNVGLDVAVQTIQFLKGDRTEWSTDNTVSAVVSGAIGGAVGGLFFGAGSVLAPRFAHSLLGKGILGAATGIGTAGIMYGIYHSGEDEFGSSISAGALGALGGGGRRRFGGKGDTVKVDPVHVNVPGALTFDPATLPATVSAEKPELSGTNTFKETAGGTTPAVTNGSAHTTGAATTAQPGTTTRTATATATANGTGTGTTGAGHGASRTGNSAVVHETTHGVSSPGTAEHETGLPGFTTTVTTASHTTASHTTASHTAASATGAPSMAGAPSAARAGTAATAPPPTRATTGGGTAGTGPTTTGVSRPTTTAGPGTTSTTATSTPTATGAARPSTVSTGPGSTATDRDSTAATGPAPSPVRAESTAGATETGASVTETGTEAGITPHETAAAPEPGTAATSAASATTATAHGTGAAPERGTGTVVGRPRGEAAAPVPDPPPPPGGHPAGSTPPPRMRLDRTLRIVVRSAFEARRFTYRDEGVTDLTVKVAFRDGGRGHDTDAVWAKVTAGVETYLNDPGYRLPGPDHTPGAGDRLHVTVVRARPGEEAHLTVDLVGHDGVMDQRRWRANAEPVEFAHELTHQVLNLRDEYRDEAVPHRPQVEGSLLGDFHTDSPDGLSRGGLRERHLQLVAAVVGDLHREEPGLGHDAEWEQTRLAATPHKRSHTWVDPVSDPSRYEPLDGSGQKASAVTDPRTTTQADLAGALEAAINNRRRQHDSDESDPEEEWSEAENDTPAPHRATALPGPYRWTAPAPAPHPAQHGNGTGTSAEGHSPDRPGTPETGTGEQQGHTDAAGHQEGADEAPVPNPDVPLLESLPSGPFEAPTLWGDDPFVFFGVAVREHRSEQTISTDPAAYSHEDTVALLPEDLGRGRWPQSEYRKAAYEAMARAAEHRLGLITGRAEQIVRTKQPGDPERDRAERLLKTEKSLKRGGWSPEYRSEFLRVQMLMTEDGFLGNLPRELVVNEHWGERSPVDADEVTSYALVPPTDLSGPIGGSLHGPGGVSEQFHSWLNRNGGDSDWLADWAEGQSGGSNTAPALRFKVMLNHFRPARHPDGFYMSRLDGPGVKDGDAPYSGHQDARPVVNFAPTYVRSMVAQHVFTHEILTRVKMPNVDPERGIVQLMRLDKRSVVDEANGDRTPDIGARIDLRRGPADSYSLMKPYKDQKKTDHGLGAFWVTAQEIPLHQVFGTYLQSRATVQGEPEHTLFLYEHENEFLAMSDGVKAVFHGTDTPPVLPVVRAESAPHTDEVSARAPVNRGSGEGSGNESPQVVDPAEARSRYGMPTANFRKFQDIAAARNLRIDVRPTNPTAAHWLEEGKLPKPKEIKAKSINDLDVRLGAKDEHIGLIGYFEPVPPERGDLDEPTWNRLEARYAQRAEEFRVLAPVMERLSAEGRFKVEDGVVLGRDDKGEWERMTGDHDMFSISTPGGTLLKGEPYHDAVTTMMANNMAVMHGAHLHWEPESPFSKGIFSKIVASHQEGGEHLLRFRPGLNNAELVYAPAEFRFTVPEPEPHPAPAEAPTDQPEPPLPPHEPLTRSGSLVATPRMEPLVEPGKTGGDGVGAAEPEPVPTRPEPAPTEPETVAAEPEPVTVKAEPEPAAVKGEPEGSPEAPRPPDDDLNRAEDPGRADAPTTVDHPAPAPEPSGPPAELGGRHQRSLAGIRITDAPGPEDLRAQVLATLPAAHRTDRQVVQKLDVEFDPANFRTRHEQMVNGGWRFQLRVAGAPHDVVLTARPDRWRLRAEQATAEEKQGKDFERSAAAERTAAPKKTSLTTSEAGLDLAPTVIRPDGSGGDRIALITPSLKAGGATHATDTSVKTGVETGTKTSLTGPTDTYVSRFRYEAAVIGPDGTPLTRPAGERTVAADVTAEITRPEPPPADGRADRWNGWESDRTAPAAGRPLDVTGLHALHDDVFRHLPREARPDGTAHRDILEFLSPKNVVDGFEHAAGWGLTSKRLDLTGGGHAWLRLTLEPGASVREGTVADKDTATSKETGEHATGRTGTSGWGLGLNGGGSRRMWQSTTTKESSWLTVTGGYSYAYSQAHQEKGKQTFSLERSLEHKGTADLVTTDVRFRLEVLRERLSPGTDGLHAVRTAPDPAPAPGEAPRDRENPPVAHTGVVLRVRHHPPAPPTDPHTPTTDTPTTDAPAPASAPHVPGDLNAPLIAQRTAFVDVPGSRELERHITERLHELAPGVLPPPGDAAGRVTPQAMENQRLLRERVSRSGLRADGGQLLDGTFRITLDASHLPGLPGRTYEVVVRAGTGTGRHDGTAAGTAKNTVARGHATDKGVTRGSKHTLGVSGNLRRALNPPDTVRAFGNAGLDGSYGPSRGMVASSETQAKRTFQHKGPADAFSYPVTYRVLVAPHREGAPPSTLPAARPAAGRGPDTVREVLPAPGDRLRVEVRRPERSATAPPHLRRPARLPQLHAVTRIADEAGFREQARTALEQVYRSREPGTVEPSPGPPLDEAVAALAGHAQLPGLVSASHAGWANTLDRHVGDGRAPDTVGLSVRTRLIDLTYEETLSGDSTLELELKASGATALADQTSLSVKGGLGPDFGLFPETATGALTTGFQVRGGGKLKGGGQWDTVDTFKQQTSTTRKVGHTGTWHVYRATAEVSVAGRLTDASGASHTGHPVRRFQDVYVVLSDEDVTRLHTATAPSPAPPELRATLLDQGVSGGALVELPGTDAVLREIDQQVRGPNDDPVPVAALPFADTYAPDSLAARYDELVGPGVLDRHVEVTRAGRVVTEVLVRATTKGWHDDGSRSDRPLTRDVTAAHTVKGKAGAKGTLGAEGNLRASVRPPVPHFNSASLTPTGALEGGRGSSAESGVTTTVGHKTSGYGDTSARFTADLQYEVTVTRRTETGRFVHLPKEPAAVGPERATAWVPESLTEDATAAPHPGAPHVLDDPAPAAVPLADHPFDLELGRLRNPARYAAWQDALRGAHDVVGFDNTKALHDTAVQVQATPRPWGDGVLGQTGAYYSWALAQSADAAGRAAHTLLPAHLTDTVSRFLATFTADPRLGPGHDLSQEQRLSVEEQFAIRQMFSGQSLPALFHQLGSSDRPYRVPGTSLAVSMEAIGPAEELAHRTAAADELSVAVKDESTTAATNSYNWTVTPADFAVLTEDPVVSVPLATNRLTRDQTYDSTRPVTRAPGTPSRPTPDATLPHGVPPADPGKAELTGPTSLMRQPVRITLHPHDDTGPYGTPRSLTGHLFHWTTTPTTETAPRAPRTTLRPPAPAPRSENPTTPLPSTHTEPHPSTHTTPRPTTPAEPHPPTPAEPHPPAAADGASAPQGPPAPDRETVTGGAGGNTKAEGEAEATTPPPPRTHDITFATEHTTTLTPTQITRLDTLAADTARNAAHRTEPDLPTVQITGHATASVAGRPHFGRSLQLAAEHAARVREFFTRRLDAHLLDLGSPLTSSAFTITTESHAPDLSHTTPDSPHRAVVTITHPPTAAHEPPHAPPLHPTQWRHRRDQAVWSVLRTERYDPARDPATDRPAPGLLAGRDVVVRAAVTRIQANDGRWVRNLSLHLPVRFGHGFGPADLAPYRDRLQSLLDTHVNNGRRLPGSGDQLHIDVDLEHRPDHPEAVEISRSERPERAWDQFTFPLGTHEGVRDDARALHELLHYSGLPDRYHDASTLFRRNEEQADRTGLMANIDTIDVPDTYLGSIAEVTDSGPVLRDLPYTEDGEPAVTGPGLTGAAARESLLTPDPRPTPDPHSPAHSTTPARPPAAAPFSGHSPADVARLVRDVLHDNTAMDGGGRNWRGAGRPRFDHTRYHVHHADADRAQHEVPWADDAYVVLARASKGHITLETPSRTVRLTEAEDFAALLANDPKRPPNSDIVLAVRGLHEAPAGLPEAVFQATGNKVWAPSGGTLELTSVRTQGTTVERIQLSGSTAHWAATTQFGRDEFAHLRPEPLITRNYQVHAADADAVLFHRLPATRLEAVHSARSAPGAPALRLPTQELDVVRAGDHPAIRVSRDRTLAIDTGGLSQHAYATERAVAESNAKLAAAGSKVRLDADPEVSLVLPRTDGEPGPGPRLLRVTPRFLTRSGRSEEEACRDFAQMVSGEVRASNVVFRAQREVATGQISALDTAEVTGTHHLAESLAGVADGKIDPAATGPAWAAAQIARDNRVVGGQGGSPLPGREYGSALSHEHLVDPRRDALTRAARRTGFNEGAWAQVGEGYMVQSINAADELGRPTLEFNYAKPGASNGSHFGYHFASVVLASEDGRTQITLENHARVSRNRAEMNAAVAENLRGSAADLREVAASLHRRVRYAERADVPAERQKTLRSWARVADLLVTAKEARDRRAPEAEQNRTLREAAGAMQGTAPMLDGKAQWYFRSYSRRPGETMHETHAELLSDHVSAEANPLTLVVLHGHAVSAPEHRSIPFDASGAMADSAGYKLDFLAEHLVRTGLWNQSHGLPLPTTDLTAHDSTPHPDLGTTSAMAARIRIELVNRIAALLHAYGSALTPEAFTISLTTALQPGTRQVTYDVNHWRTPRPTTT
ncbi:hypothetical protein ABZ770_29915 [Streptomyces sp. NPDC006654]|uniref:WXG100-like domain-containing protein n=1 Tax=Streptomyces sp. NPDC006654 TaxID=3156897 RepID=UPI0033D27488